MEAGIGVMGTKLGMMSFFNDSGAVVPVTVVGFREGNIVTQVKTELTDGYNAVQVGYRLQTVDGFEPNQRFSVEELFKEGDLVNVSGTTIGKGF
ncbi:50S ribosomal L3, chloroplastic [Olea europaea subsp. europaea]|uniref:50S ribosomal L3, chloroplastic n=1 Tax=Olea europaea subsp. europaea TaxID=158383 RepID=A0A8S0SN99_OLEEU|nr:50S ribosomal L3, chloroplastic [Olea europaea subsp. europaea]